MKEYTEITKTELSSVLPWSYPTISKILDMGQFSRYVDFSKPRRHTIKIEYLTRVNKLIYEAMANSRFRGKLMNGG